MAGKSYTMKEMRSIVEYLTERKAYGEIKGRKMWMEYANSQHTTRTWQSLKETFLKRILPSIHDPYYKLSAEQVRSFKQGCDVEEKEKNNKLDLRTASEDSNTDGERQNKNDQPTTSKVNEQQITAVDYEPPTSIDNEVEKVTGEGVTCEKVTSRNRSSADTVVLEYENAEEIQRALESPGNDEDNNKNESKSYKDLLTFEPMTPLVKELVDAFETESESSDKEPRLSIDETLREVREPEPVVINSSENRNSVNVPESVIVINDSEDLPSVQTNDKILKTEGSKSSESKNSMLKNKDDIDEPSKTRSIKLKKFQKDTIGDGNHDKTNNHEPNKEQDPQNNEVTNPAQETTEFVTAKSHSKTLEKSSNSTTTENNNGKKKNATEDSKISSQNTGNTSTDTLLPNNQEALDNSIKATQDTNLNTIEDDVQKVEITKNMSKKRANSQDNREKKKQKLSDNEKNQTKEDDRTTPIIEILDTPITEQEHLSKNEENSKDPNLKSVDHNTLIDYTEKQHNIILNSSENTNKPACTEEVSNDTSKEIKKVAIEDQNPCLLSVSLFEEQFKNTKYSDSDSDAKATSAPKQNEKPQTLQKQIVKEDKLQKHKNKEQEVILVQDENKEKEILMKSSTESEVHKSRDNVKLDNISMKTQRERALANVFGFAHGAGASTNRKRRMSHRRRSQHHYHRKRSINHESDSSEWTSESDSESYVSPPRGRRNRHTRKYMRPRSSRILQDPEEGTLYVKFGKNIYPLVKDGRHIKNFLTYRPDSDSDREEESYWKKKYVDEKRRLDDFKKLLKESRDNNVLHANEPTSPAPRFSPGNQQRSVPKDNGKEPSVQREVEKYTDSKNEKMVLKIAAKNGLEYCLEGGWTQISNAMPQMVKILRHETDSINEDTKGKQIRTSEAHQPAKAQEPMEVSSGVSTPQIASLAVDPEIHEKVNKLETEIFKEIEELEKEAQADLEGPENVTRRRVRQKKECSTSTNSTPGKRARVSKTSSTDSKPETTNPAKGNRKSKKELDMEIPPLELKSIVEEQPTAETRKTRKRTVAEKTTDKNTNETTMQDAVQQNDPIDEKQPVRSLRNIQQREITPVDQIRSKLKDRSRSSKLSDNASVGSAEIPAGSKKSTARQIRTPKKNDTPVSDLKIQTKKSSTKETKLLIGFDEDARFMFPPTAKDDNKLSKGNIVKRSPALDIITIQDYVPGNAIDSTQGYQDSEASSNRICLRNRKRKPSLHIQRKNKNRRRQTRRNSYPIILQELSSDSNNSSYFKPMRKSQSTLNSEIYRTESFQLLMTKKLHSFNKLTPIDEIQPGTQQFDTNIRHFNSLSKSSSNNNSNINLEVASSSGISLPLSPELSVVEKLSVSREIIINANSPNINYIQSNNSSNEMELSEYLISNLDVSIPLMNQQWNLQKSENKLTPTINVSIPTPPFNDAKLSKPCSVRLENLTLSESLDQRLRDLLLESNKKCTKNDVEVDQTKFTTGEKTTPNKHNENMMDVDESAIKVTKKTKAKRSSTPRKKKVAHTAIPLKDAVIEEEHMESCSYGGRKSCPPVITFFSVDENANNANVTLKTDKAKTKKKKDVIKVKILKPKKKRESKKKFRESTVENGSAVSIFTDSGINDTDNLYGMFTKESEDSVDLIHNHSETCLLANECIEDGSVEFIDNSKSVISLNSTRSSFDSESLLRLPEDVADKPASGEHLSDEVFQTPETLYLSSETAEACSFITEDLSDERPTQPTKWYLLDEETNSRPETKFTSYGSNLKQIFPIACAVPNLSTISEMSKENEDSTSNKPNVGHNVRDSGLLSPMTFKNMLKSTHISKNL